MKTRSVLRRTTWFIGGPGMDQLQLAAVVEVPERDGPTSFARARASAALPSSGYRNHRLSLAQDNCLSGEADTATPQ